MDMQGIKLVQVAERRRHLRFDLDRFTCVTAVAGGRLYECQVADISLGGLRLRFAGPPPADLTLTTPGGFTGEIEMRISIEFNDQGGMFGGSLVEGIQSIIVNS